MCTYTYIKSSWIIAINYIKGYNYIIHIYRASPIFVHTYQKFATTDHHVLVCQSFLDPIPPIAAEIYVQLEALFFTVEEEMGFVEICVNVSTDEDNECPIEFDVGVTLSTRDGTAGIYSYNIMKMVHIIVSHLVHTVTAKDFEILSDEVFIPECQRSMCMNVTIIDDTKVEGEEMFNVTLERSPALQGNVKVVRERSVATITIIDKDSTCYTYSMLRCT